MPKRPTPFVPGEWFHVYNRGNSKQEIFKSLADYDRFVKSLYLANSRKNIHFRDDIERQNISAWNFLRGTPLVSIASWVLMPNHFHLLVQEPITKTGTWETENGLSLFLRKLGVGYSMYFNKKYERTGALFEGRFKAKHVDSEEYLRYLLAYIHLNPIKLIQSDWREVGIRDEAAAREYLKRYEYSSFLDIAQIRERPERTILQYDDISGVLGSPAEFENHIFEWFNDSRTVFSPEGLTPVSVG